MSDSRLNSIHLDSIRREDFRRARELLLGAVGEETRRAEHRSKFPVAAPAGRPANLPPSKLPFSETDFVLMDRDRVYSLKVGLNTIGRMSDNDVVIPDPYLSRRHCAILVHTVNGCELHDVASKNGTFLNGKAISGPTRLMSGDEILICDRNLVFLCKSDIENDASRSIPSGDITLAE